MMTATSTNSQPNCTYCHKHIGTFFITQLRKWACGTCYTHHHITPKVRELVHA